jgi:exodeoxyribonuclease V alpha subunit
MTKGNPNTLAKLRGQLERITYEDLANGYVVAKVRVYGQSDLITIVGNIPSITPGEILSMSGKWVYHPKFGQQFQVVFCSCSVPASLVGIEKYLGSGLIKGIGPALASRIVSVFKEKTLDIIENKCEKLLDVPGIGNLRIQKISQAWKEQKAVREVMVFLQSHGVSTAYATKIYKQYGNESITLVTENPYRLAYDIRGIGFLTADRIAQKLEFDKNSTMRAGAGVLHALHELTDQGHVYAPVTELVDKSAEMLEVDKNVVKMAMQGLLAEQKIVVENLRQVEGMFLPGYHMAEVQTAEMLKILRDSKKVIPTVSDDETVIESVQKNLTISLAARQVEAVRSALHNKVLVITGGPGVGKTTIIRSILQIFSAVTKRICLAAPTGRAAKRMEEATGFEAKTIHRLLQFSVGKGGFQKNADYQLDCDLIIIDEASMIDTLLIYHLLKAIPKFATLILVGDINQLPSVGAGNVLKDIIHSNAFTVIELNEIFRQSAASKIITNAHMIISGQFPEISSTEPTDFYFINEDDLEKASEKIIRLVKTHIPQRFGFNPITDIQVLTPMNRGLVGTNQLNESLQNALNPDGFEIMHGGRRFRVGDKVMQIKNNYDKDVFNGDLGFITYIDSEEHIVTMSIDGRAVNYEFSELDELILAYAISIHKSQGSEYPVVVIPIVMAHCQMLQRNLIYTGITRGKKLVVLIGSKKALDLAVKNNNAMTRNTWLKRRLM